MLRRAGFLWPDGNTLRRRADRVESAIVAGLLVFLLLAAPAAALVTGSLADHADRAEVRTEQTWHRVTASLTTRGVQQLQAAATGWVVLSVEAHWTAGGREHTGWIPVSPAARRTDTAPVWVSPAGTPTGPPGAAQTLHLAVALAALAGALLAGGLVFLAGVAARMAMNRRRMEGWEIAWRAVGPEWSRQL
jgi:hypothetical protein